MAVLVAVAMGVVVVEGLVGVVVVVVVVEGLVGVVVGAVVLEGLLTVAVVALKETIRLMEGIDAIIPSWPIE